MRRRILVSSFFAVLLVSSFYFWWVGSPKLVIYLDPNLREAIDLDALEIPLRDAGARRFEYIHRLPEDGELGQRKDSVAIALLLSQDRNPELDEEMLARGLTGPGYTYGYSCFVYEPDCKLFIQKHREKLLKDGLQDWTEISRRLKTNTAAHEAWHAICQSTSHNPSNPKSLMYMDPARSPRTYCWDRPLFTQGHKARLQSVFATRYPWEN